MIEIKLGTRYAKSIYSLAEEKGTLEDVKRDFSLLRDVCQNRPDFVTMLKSPLIYPDRKQGVVDKIFGGKLSKITSELIAIMIRKGREPYLRDIAECFLSIYDERNKITRGVLTSSRPVSESLRTEIRKIVEKDLGTTFILEEKIDPKLLGGFVLEVGDRLFDGSLAGKLNRLEQEFEKNLYIAKV